MTSERTISTPEDLANWIAELIHADPDLAEMVAKEIRRLKTLDEETAQILKRARDREHGS